MTNWNKINAYVELLRPQNAATALLAFLIGFFFSNHTIIWNELFAGLTILILLHAAATLQNDVEDIKIDTINAPMKPLQSKKISLYEAKRFLYLLLLIVLLLSIVIFPFYLFISVPFALLIIWLYNKKPFLLSHKPIASILLLTSSYALLPILFGLVLSKQAISPLLIIWLLSWFLIRFSIIILKDYKDEKGDKRYGKKTFFLVFGKRYTDTLSITLSVIGYLSLLSSSFFLRDNFLFLIIAFIFAFFSFLPRIALPKTKESQKANLIFHKILFRENRFELLYLLWLIFSR